MTAKAQWTLKCCNCESRTDVSVRGDGEPDYLTLSYPWRRFTYESRGLRRECGANACSDFCEERYRAEYGRAPRATA